jgi:hypothetical protein
MRPRTSAAIGQPGRLSACSAAPMEWQALTQRTKATSFPFMWRDVRELIDIPRLVPLAGLGGVEPVVNPEAAVDRRLAEADRHRPRATRECAHFAPSLPKRGPTEARREGNSPHSRLRGSRHWGWLSRSAPAGSTAEAQGRHSTPALGASIDAGHAAKRCARSAHPGALPQPVRRNANRRNSGSRIPGPFPKYPVPSTRYLLTPSPLPAHPARRHRRLVRGRG